MPGASGTAPGIPDGRAAQVTVPGGPVLGLFVASMLVMLGFGIVSPLLGIFALELGASGTILGILYGVFALSRALSTPVVGRISDRVDKRRVILTGLALVCVLAVLYSRTHSLGVLLLVRLLHGVSSAMVIPIALARVAEMAPRAHEGEMMGTFSISLTLGMAFGPLVGGLLYEHGGFETAFLSLAALGAIGLVVVAARVPPATGRRRRPPSSMARMARDPQILALAWCRFLAACCISTLLAYLPIHASQTALGVGYAGAVITTSLLVSAALQRLAGQIADRSSRIGMLVAGICLLGLLIALIPSCGDRWVLGGVAILIGVARATTISANGALIATLGRVHGTGSLMGMINTAMAVGLGGGPLVAGICMQRVGLPFAFRAIGLGSLLGAIAAGVVLARQSRTAHTNA